MDTPVIKQLHAKIVAGERRKVFLEKKLSQRVGTETSMDYDRAEVAFIDAGVRALKFVELFRWPEMSPVNALERLLEALDNAGIPGQSNDHDEVAVQVTKARRTLQALKDEKDQ